MSARLPGTWLLLAAAVVVVATLVAAIASIGLPSEQRLERLDERRVADLGNLESAIDAHVRTADALPTTLAELAAEPGMRLSTVDPESGRPYEYVVRGARAYRLCAVFATDTARTRADVAARGAYSRWFHGKGRHCFERRLDAAGSKAVVLP